MKNSAIFLFTAVLIFGLLIQPGCKTDEDALQFTLTVTLGTGVSGVPAAGTYTYNENQVVTYSYTTDTGYENLVVILDGTAIADSGLITMNSNHTLNVNATEMFNVNGDWEGEFIDSELYDHYALVLSFSGGYFTGTVTGTGAWSENNVSGSYTISNGQIEFHLENQDFVAEIMFFTGTIDDNNHMSGEFVEDEETGSWSLERQ
jgi:hypothetical protein